LWRGQGSKNHLDAFIKRYIEPLEGVVDTEITFIGKTVRLVPPGDWERSVGPFFVAPSGARVKDIDAEDDSLMAGCWMPMSDPITRGVQMVS
jgi:hypothetical protein